MNRPAMVAGGFYPKDPAELARMVDGFLSHAKPPALPGEPLGILVPHAGYAYSGSVAAHGYKTIGKKVKTVILLGVAHRVPVQGAAVWSHGAFETPLGRIPVNEALSKKIMAASSLIRADTKPHENEHSIEVQLPFLQRTLGEFSIVPLLLNNDRDLEALREIGHAIAEGARGESVLLVLSSDLSHYPTSDLATLVDRTTLSSLGSFDPLFVRDTSEALLNREEKALDCAMCGEAAVIAGLSALKEMGANQAVVVGAQNSGETPGVGDPSHVVGYGAVAFVKAASPKPFGFSLTEEQKAFLLKSARLSIADGLNGVRYQPHSLSTWANCNFPAAVFVTLREDGQLRGCIGTTEAHNTLLENVRTYARAAAFEDPRFPRLAKNELEKIHIEISLLSRPVPVQSAAEIIPLKHGVVVQKGMKRGLFLPSVWEQLPDKEAFLSELCSQKAGLPRDAWKNPDVTLSVFTSDAFEEPPRRAE